MRSDSAATQRPARPGWTLALVAVAAFLTSLDVMVVVTAIPTIRQDLNASLADLEWTINAYNLAFGCLMLTGAALGDRYGRMRVYVIGLAVFTIASAMAAVAPTVGILIVARVLQGVAAGIAIPVSLTLLSDAYPPEKRGMAMGIWGSVSGLAVAAGPVVGGLITEGLSWHWIFWLNVPFGIAATVLSAVLLRESYGPRPKLDLVGLALASVGLFGLVWAAVRQPALGWGNAEVLLSIIIGLALLVAFVFWEKRVEHPLLPMEYFRIRGFTIANVSAFFQHFALIGALFMLGQMFQEGLGNGPMGTGLRLLAWTAMPLLVAPIAGGFADKLGNRPFMVGGLLLQGVGLAWIAAVAAPDTGYGAFIVPLILGGIGIAMCLPTTINLVFASVPQNDVGVASGVNSSVREIGGVFGVVVLGAAFATYGGYGDPSTAMDGFQAAFVVGAIASVVGMIAAVFAPGKNPAGQSATPAAEPVGVETAK
ncbi:DHA2 family efflux MFS transporter permease subunit [Saccharothrix luteola]|uniref:DHA2 family efflux MFS transporter permease subunit n=1 Tax=Saccharothrix luteola TaxID=2893018 RepID=UPI001E30D0F2|nr:DHA2 family efflux MFS transporter permease subunit [Saccharothrix luteola]MCC8245904.1 DHA2 family efflux MFS transporter permease subunit [Saccharothrix luteola]MCC8248336.1 DHA2 family efflux MFS transporter permease subunit [Saccharothrix luteola]